MATLNVQDLVKSGALEATYVAAAAGGDEMPNDGKTLLHVKNASGVQVTVTVTAQQVLKDFGGSHGVYTRANIAEAIPAGEERLIGPLPATAWNNVNGRAAVTYSAVTSVTVAALRMPS